MVVVPCELRTTAYDATAAPRSADAKHTTTNINVFFLIIFVLVSHSKRIIVQIYYKKLENSRKNQSMTITSVTGTPKGITAQRLLGVTGGAHCVRLLGAELKLLTGVRE
jgi:hypothetical protein